VDGINEISQNRFLEAKKFITSLKSMEKEKVFKETSESLDYVTAEEKLIEDIKNLFCRFSETQKEAYYYSIWLLLLI
jgi:hypothetical protein